MMRTLLIAIFVASVLLTWVSLFYLPPEVAIHFGADGVPDGTIDDADYEFWVEQFSTDVSPGSGGTALPVPEPTSLALIVLAILFVNFAHRRLT